MSLVYIFGDESGNLDFSRKQGASRYFIITTVTLHNCSIGSDLLEMKRRLHWDGYEVKDFFHATEDKQAVRDQVFHLLSQHDFRVDTTLLEKAKTFPRIASDTERFYKLAWYYHLKYVVPEAVAPADDVYLVAASFGTKAKRQSAHSALKDVIAQVAPGRKYEVAFWPACTDPCLQVADYCCWAIQKKWESNDMRSYRLVAGKISTEFDVFRAGTTYYY